MSEASIAAPATTATPAPVADAKPGAHVNLPVSPAPKAPVSTPKAEAAAPKEVKAAPTAPEEFFDVPVNGKTVKMTKAELFKEASLSKGAFQRFEEAAKLRREAEGVLGRLRDPKEAIKLLNDPKLGLNKDQVRAALEEWYTENVIAPAEMTPEQRELSEAKKRISDFEAREAELKKHQEAQENERMDAETAQHLQQEIIQLVEKSGLPKTRYTSARIAYWLRVNESKGLKAPTELIIEQVKKETRDVMSSLVEASDGDVLVNLLGENTVKKLRAYDLARIRAKRGQTQTEQKPEIDSPKQLETITESEWKRRLRDWN